jgi:ribonucleoside-diphosphate reductase alpha chain
MQKGKQFLSDLKLHSDYLKWKGGEEGRYETWDEACQSIVDGHRDHYSYLIDRDSNTLNSLLDNALKLMQSKTILASQRSLQYRAESLKKNNARLYNCSSMYAARNTIFQETFWLLLSGCGVGVSLLKPFVQNLSNIGKRTKGTKTVIIEDSIEGWANALGILMSSFFIDNQPFPEYAGYEIKFDYSLIRPKGSYITGGFKAPGPDGLAHALNTIESLLNNWLVTEGSTLRPIAVCDILCHAADAVLSGGVRRAALNMIVDPYDEEMKNAKIGDWRTKNPQRGRTNNSVLLLRNNTSKKEFEEIVLMNDGISDLGFAFANSWFDMFNPCFEISLHPILYKKLSTSLDQIAYEDIYKTVHNHESLLGVSFCNLTEINAEACHTPTEFFKACTSAAVIGTVQAGYTNFPYLGPTTEQIVRQDALLGVSITGWMNNPMLFNADLLKEGANIIKDTNKRVANLIKINQAARTTCVKPSGNASVVLGTASGIHPEHSQRYFRIMQLNKENAAAKWLLENMPELLEESQHSATNADYVVYVPIENPDTGLFKKDMKGVEHLKLIQLAQTNWVNEGTNRNLGAYPNVNHNTSNTVIIDNPQDVINYIWENRKDFTAVSFISDYGDKDFIQAPFTSVLSMEEIIETYGKGALFISGLIVDGLHYFNENLWTACELLQDKSIPVTGTREQVMLRKYWIARAKQFANNFFDGDLQKTIYCLKDVHLLHKWEVINRTFHPVDFGKILTMPTYKSVSDYAATACSGNQCEITRL